MPKKGTDKQAAAVAPAGSDPPPPDGVDISVSKLLKQSHAARTNLLFGAQEGDEVAAAYARFFDELEAKSSTDKHFLLAHVLSAIALLIAPGARSPLRPPLASSPSRPSGLCPRRNWPLPTPAPPPRAHRPRLAAD